MNMAEHLSNCEMLTVLHTMEVTLHLHTKEIQLTLLILSQWVAVWQMIL
jgi:hypothetical protein